MSKNDKIILMTSDVNSLHTLIDTFNMYKRRLKMIDVSRKDEITHTEKMLEKTYQEIMNFGGGN